MEQEGRIEHGPQAYWRSHLALPLASSIPGCRGITRPGTASVAWKTVTAATSAPVILFLTPSPSVPLPNRSTVLDAKVLIESSVGELAQ